MTVLESPVSVPSLQGLVIKKSKGYYFVEAPQGPPVLCRITNKLRKDMDYSTADTSSVGRRVRQVRAIRQVDPVAVGDWVEYQATGQGTGKILAVCPRRNKFNRRAAGLRPMEQVIVANIDTVVAVFSAALPDPNWALLDRYLVGAEALGLPIAVVMTKMDVPGALEEIEEYVQVYRQLGYPVVLTSAVTGQGLAEVQALLRDRVCVLVGKSGVGKSTLINTLAPELDLRTGEVSDFTGKGCHTTTHLEMHTLPGGGRIVDTPGMKEFGLWELGPQALDGYFPEMRSLQGACQFGSDCTHAHEPGCAVQQAVEDGTIHFSRYDSYLTLHEELKPDVSWQ